MGADQDGHSFCSDNQNQGYLCRHTSLLAVLGRIWIIKKERCLPSFQFQRHVFPTLRYVCSLRIAREGISLINPSLHLHYAQSQPVCLAEA